LRFLLNSKPIDQEDVLSVSISSCGLTTAGHSPLTGLHFLLFKLLFASFLPF
jgi:hypothetical protein